MSTIVLVGGSFLGAWAWERVTPVLVAAGHDVHPLTLTGFGDRAHLATEATGLTLHATDIAAAIETANLRDVVLVAHSYGAAPATIAASRVADRVRAVVYVAGVLPEPGKTLFELVPSYVEEAIMASVDAFDGWQIPVMSDAELDAFFGDHGLTAADRAWLRARGAAQPIATYREAAPADLSGVAALHRTYIACSGDEPPSVPGMDVVPLASGHWPMITRPLELAQLLDALVQA